MNFHSIDYPYDLRIKKIKFEKEIFSNDKVHVKEYHYRAINRRKVIGFIITHNYLFKKEGCIANLYVEKFYRRNGIGTSLMNMAINDIHENKIKETSLIALPHPDGPSLKEIIKFYESFGFKINQYYEDDYSCCEMIKTDI